MKFGFGTIDYGSELYYNKLDTMSKQNKIDSIIKNGAVYLYEASVGGGIPVIAPLKDCFTGDDILRVAGILNGTTNFILTKMIEDGMAFQDALKLAQDNGYAEHDPSADILGHDAARKICILAQKFFCF